MFAKATGDMSIKDASAWTKQEIRQADERA
jgi:hypothetical protein